MITLAGIHKSFKDNHVLKGIDLTVRKGEVVCVLGPSGSGKTTLLRSVNFLTRADSGEITVDDIQVDCAAATKRDIMSLRRATAMVFQQCNLFVNRTAIENVMEGLVVVQKLKKKELTKRVTIISKRSVCSTKSTNTRTNSPAGSSSAWASRARSR